MTILIPYYSMYGHVHELAKAISEGVKESGGDPILCRVKETLPDAVLEKMGAIKAKDIFKDIPVCKVEDLDGADGVIMGSPTRFGNMSAQMKAFIDATGKYWLSGALVGKVGGAFAGSATQHGGQESTILSMHIPLMHLGMVIVGLPYAWQGQMTMDEISGGSPYGIATISGGEGQRMPSKNELDGARFQGKHTAMIASKLS